MLGLQLGIRSLQPSFIRRAIIHHSSTTIQPLFILVIHLDNVELEDVEDYQLGGLHPISLGDSFSRGRYKILHKLGFGASSAIWLARDQGGTKPGRLVALKALRANVSRPDNPELTVLKILQAVTPPVSCIRPVYDHFSVKGPNGSHIFVVYPFVGPNITSMVSSPPRVAWSKRLRADLARKVVKQFMHTVDFMYRAVGQSYAVNSKPADCSPGALINYFPPETRFERRAGFEADVWMLACAIFEIRSGFGLFSSVFGRDLQVLKEAIGMLGKLPDPWWDQFGKELKVVHGQWGTPESQSTRERWDHASCREDLHLRKAALDRYKRQPANYR